MLEQNNIQPLMKDEDASELDWLIVDALKSLVLGDPAEHAKLLHMASNRELPVSTGSFKKKKAS